MCSSDLLSIGQWYEPYIYDANTRRVKRQKILPARIWQSVSNERTFRSARVHHMAADKVHEMPGGELETKPSVNKNESCPLRLDRQCPPPKTQESTPMPVSVKRKQSQKNKLERYIRKEARVSRRATPRHAHETVCLP